MAGNLLLFFSPGSQTWQQFDLPDPQQGQTLGIGRGVENTFVIDDPGISTNHALFLNDPQGFYILDQFSSNGVIVNGQRIPVNEWVPLAPGVYFTLGNTQFHIQPGTFEPQIPQQVPQFQPAQEVQPGVTSVAVQPARKRSPVLWIVGGGILLLVLVGFGLVWLFGGRSGGGPVLAGDQSLTLAADGQTLTDANGVSVTVPIDALQDATASLYTSSLSDEVLMDLSDEYKVISPAYNLTANGASDGSEPAVLSFPAEDDALRLMVIIDGTYAAELDLKPENGFLTIPADIRPSDLGELSGSDPMFQTGSIQYVLVRPKKVQAQATRSMKLAAPAGQDDPFVCSSWTRSYCYQNGNGSVQLMFNRDNKLTPVQADAVINYIQNTMQQYEDAGFDGAIITHSNPIQVVLTAKGGVPDYVVANGVIYLPFDIATKIVGGGRDDFLIHEMAHWIQDEHYFMCAAALVQDGRWWIETSAENMMMLIDNGHVAINLASYGNINADEKNSVLQMAPYQWPNDESYAMAQLVKVNMCAGSACPFSQTKFVEIINAGEFPFNDEANREKVHANLADYASYLLGVAPTRANAQIPLAEVTAGFSYGDFISIKKTTNSDFELGEYGGGGRITSETIGGLPAKKIEATLQKDGVYVLRIDVEQGAPSEWPAVLRVEPGAPFYYRIDNGEIQFSDGKQETLIQPIAKGTTDKEIAQLRLVAVGQEGGEVFKATLSAMDLSGTWIFDIPDESTWISNLSCEDDAVTSYVRGLRITTMGLAMSMGDFQQDINTQSLTWTLNAERASALLSKMGLTGEPDNVEGVFTGGALVFPDGMELELTAIEPETTSFTVDPGAYKSYFITVPGTVTARVVYNQFTFVGTEVSNAFMINPMIQTWKLSGANVTFTYDVDEMYTEVNSSGAVVKNEKIHCSGTVEVPMSVSIYQEKK